MRGASSTYFRGAPVIEVVESSILITLLVLCAGNALHELRYCLRENTQQFVQGTIAISGRLAGVWTGSTAVPVERVRPGRHRGATQSRPLIRGAHDESVEG